MKTYSEDLAFNLKECSPLATVLVKYGRYAKPLLPQETVVRLNGYTDRALAVSGNDTLFMQAILKRVTSRDERRKFLQIRQSVTDKNTATEEVLDVLEGKDLYLSESRPILMPAFFWAGGQMVRGSGLVQAEVSELLNSSFEDSNVSRMLGSTNEGLASLALENLLSAGDKARAWYGELGGDN